MTFLQDTERLPSSPYQAYLMESRKPAVCLVFTLPFFISYHIGVWWIRERAPIPWANGADVLLTRILNLIGIGGPLISFFLVVTVFLFLQTSGGRSWRMRMSTLLLMIPECCIWSLPPFLLGKAVAMLIPASIRLSADGGWMPSDAAMEFGVNLILSVGAGVYEEFLFRMLLLGGLFALFRHIFGMEGTRLYVTAVLTQALLFALFHHLPGGPTPLTFGSLLDPSFLRAFAFRTLAGIYFAYVYQERGFGITAGSHAIYDIVAVTLNAVR